LRTLTIFQLYMNLKIISAGAGSGKTYRLTQEMFALLQSGVRASGIIATTFTKKAAAELQERVRTKLLEEGLTQAANDLSNALIGTVNSLGVKLLKRFAFEAGVSPQTDVIAEEDQQMMFNLSLSQILTHDRVERMNILADKLGVNKKAQHDWRKDIKNITDVARSNNFTTEILQKSKYLSFQTFQKLILSEIEPTHEEAIFGQEMIRISNEMLVKGVSYHSNNIIASETEDWNTRIFHEKLNKLLSETLAKLKSGTDTTKVTGAVVNDFKLYLRELQLRGTLYWHQIVRISKAEVGAKSREHVQELKDFAQKHLQLPEFQQDIHDYIELMFDISADALKEFDRYKKQRGLIDYIDMEVHINRLMDNPAVCEVLADELDLLMVDEFQDTSPIQLEIFLKMSRVAKHSIWVGDPKQSIYGFRGADPQLMQAIIEQTGGIKSEDILTTSWRSRPDVVNLTNSLFCKTFQNLPKEQIALNAKRPNREGQTDAIVHWHFNPDGEKRPPASPWMENCIADSLKLFLNQNVLILPKGKNEMRPILPKDVVVLCRSNARCNSMAEALHRVGLKASISRNGLLQTAEAKLVTACLRFILNRHDSLAIAEILVLADHQDIGAVLDDRLNYLAQLGEKYDWRWAVDNPLILKINELRKGVTELSPVEILNLMLEELDLRRIVSSFGSAFQRIENIDQLRYFAKHYEDNCTRLHIAASLGGFLVWLNELSRAEKDAQSAGESADAVHVMTYHKSKGLEFPVVILHDLDNNLRNEVWGVHIVPEKETVDLNNLLGNRWLRFWINPYADQSKNTKLQNAIDASEAKKIVTAAALAEEARLLYVGITRARDYLVFPTTLTPTRWLNRAWHQNEDIPTFDKGNDTVFEWEKRYLSKYFEEFWYPKTFTHAPALPEEIRFLEERAGKKVGKAYKIDVERDYFAYEMNFNFNATERYTATMSIKDTDKTSWVAKLCRAFWHGDNPAYSEVQRLQIAKNMLERFELDDTIDYHVLPKQMTDFYNFIDKKFKKSVVKRRYPVRYHHRKRLFEGQIDCLVEHERGIAIFQTNDYVGNPMKLRTEAIKQTGFLYLCQKMLTQTRDVSEIVTFVHFPLMGVVIEVKIHHLNN
jgi:ATP-dependent helicase/nuclease subunit A